MKKPDKAVNEQLKKLLEELYSEAQDINPIHYGEDFPSPEDFYLDGPPIGFCNICGDQCLEGSLIAIDIEEFMCEDCAAEYEDSLAEQYQRNMLSWHKYLEGLSEE